MSSIRLSLNIMNILVEGDAWEFQDYMLYSPNDSLIVMKDTMPFGEVHMFIHVEACPEIGMVLFGSAYKVSNIAGGSYDVTTTRLTQELEYTIRKCMKLPEEYIVTDFDSLDVFTERCQALRKQWIDTLVCSFPYDIAEYMFNTVIAKDFKSIALGKDVPQRTVLRAHDFYVLDDAIPEWEKRIRHAIPNTITKKFMSYFEGLQLDYNECDNSGPLTWCTLYDDAFVQVMLYV